MRQFNMFSNSFEEVTTYTTLASRGDLFLTVPFVGLEQKATQTQTGGMTDAYLTQGTYVKSFTTVLMQPSSVKVSMMGFTEKRLHHRVSWSNTTPMILRKHG